MPNKPLARPPQSATPADPQPSVSENPLSAQSTAAVICSAEMRQPRLYAERGAAAAGGLGVGIVEHKALAVQPAGVVQFSAC